LDDVFQKQCHTEEIEAAYFFHLKNAFGTMGSFALYLLGFRRFWLCPPKWNQIATLARSHIRNRLIVVLVKKVTYDTGFTFSAVIWGLLFFKK